LTSILGRASSPSANSSRPRIAAITALLLLAALGLASPARAQTDDDPSSARERAAAALTVPDPNPPIQGRVDPDTYRVGPGDEFAFRHSDLTDPKILRVGPAGEILFPDAGAVFVAGLTLREAETKVRDALRAYVRGKGLVFSLYRPRRFRLPVLGEVERPGVVTVTAPVRASEAIEAAGGIAPGGARRGIVIRRGADSLRVDLVRYETAGDLSGNPLVFETDVVFVPAAGRYVQIFGAVAHPGSYDLVPGDRVSDLVALAGGARPEAALDRVELERFDSTGSAARRTILLSAEAGLGRGGDDPVLNELDRVFVPARGRYREGAVVEVVGEATHPGPYSIREGVDGVRSILERAGGFTEFADLSRATIERRAESAARDTAFLHLADGHQDILTEEERRYVKLRTRQRDAVSADLSRVLASADGAVAVSGTGTGSEDPPGESGHAAAAPRVGMGAGSDIALFDGDRIVIPRRYSSVSVQGEVRSPGLVPYESGRGVDDYVRAAGGFTHRASKGDTRVAVARTGQQMKPGETGGIHAGDTVWVPAKPPRSGWSTVRDVITTAAQVATIYLVIKQATK
jgi:protein involved in polysaccharide export with SLBB domain